MKHRLTRIVVMCGVVFSLAPFTAAHADGLFVPQPDYWVNETNQEAVIFYKDAQEDLIVSSGFSGNAQQFAWIIPTPAVPTIERGSWELFAGLRDITQSPIQDVRLGSPIEAFDSSSYIDKNVVQEIERQSIAYYDIAVLDARSTDGLLQWFSDNGFSYPADQKYILDDYINAGWYFTAVKLNTDTLSKTTKDAVTSGSSIPLHLSFAADRMVFPLQLSQVTSQYDSATKKYPVPTTVGITLYVIADHRQSLPQFSQNYAGYLTAKAVSELSFDTAGKPLLLKDFDATKDTDTRYVLTKLEREFPVSEMTYDLYPREEENTSVLNDVEAISSSTRNLWIIGGISVLSIGLLVWAIRKMSIHSHSND